MADRTVNSKIWGRQETLEQGSMATPEFLSRPPSYREYDDPYEDGFPRASRSSSIERLSDRGMVRRVNTGSNFSYDLPASYGDVQNQVAKSQEESIAMMHFQDSEDAIVLEALEVETASGGPPDCFANVIPGVYRSSFPQAKDHEFLKTLHLKTIVTLVEKEYPDGFVEFMQDNGIRHYIIAMQGTKKESIPQETMRSIMDILLDTASHPVLVHCNKGKHRTGCSVAAIRHASGWKVEDIVNEYESFAEPKIRDCDVKYIKQYQVSDVEKGRYYKLFPQNGMQPMQPVLLSSSMVPYYMVAAFLIFIICVCTPYSRA